MTLTTWIFIYILFGMYGYMIMAIEIERKHRKETGKVNHLGIVVMFIQICLLATPTFLLHIIRSLFK